MKYQRGQAAHSSASCAQPSAFNTRIAEAGDLVRKWIGLLGLGVRLPPQFGHLPFNVPAAHSEQNVHSKLQMKASSLVGGRSRSQHSQFGRSSSISASSVGVFCFAVIHSL
jgi:hypothetical protein